MQRLSPWYKRYLLPGMTLRGMLIKQLALQSNSVATITFMHKCLPSAGIADILRSQVHKRQAISCLTRYGEVLRKRLDSHTIIFMVYSCFTNLLLHCLKFGSADKAWLKLDNTYSTYPAALAVHESQQRASALGLFNILKCLHLFPIILDGSNATKKIEELIEFRSD